MAKPQCCGREMRKDGFAGSGNQRYRCGACNRRTVAGKAAPSDQGYDEDLAYERLADLKLAVKSGCQRYVITAAQNNTRVNKPFLRALEHYCEENNAELVVIPVHYKNISLYTASQEFKKWWAADLEQYLIDDRIYLGGNVEVAADTKIAATAANPLSGMQEVGGSRWQVIGHAQVAMQPVAAPVGEIPKRIYTTGSCTYRNYSRTKDGKKAEFHHSFAALVVEPQGKTAFCRQLVWGENSFYDLAGGAVKKYTQEGVEDGGRALALTTGDEHVKFYDKGVFRATYAPGGLVDTLRPEYLVRHDVLDGYAGSHHHERDPLVQFEKFHSRNNCYRSELDEVVDFINRTTPPDCVNVMVDSNHHDHLQQFLNKADANKDHQNALFISEMQQAQREAILAGEDPRPLRLYCKDRIQVDAKWLNRRDTFLIKGVDYSQHGDVGLNGARGSAASMARTTHKAVIGHSHSPMIVKGVYQVGKSTGTLEYERGLSTHWQTHCVQWPNGKRALLDIFNGKSYL